MKPMNVTIRSLFKSPGVYLVLPLIAWLGNALYAVGPRGEWLEFYSPALVAIALIAYVILHGTQRYGLAAMWSFAWIVFSVAWGFETLSLVTGLPFGNYHYTELMAPFLWHVPVFVLPAYALMGYISWSLATLLLNQRAPTLERHAVVSVPVLAALCMVAWDLSMDPLRATIEARWVWLDGGAHFGVPGSNYAGWFAVTWLMFQLFALYLRSNRHPIGRVQLHKPPACLLFWISVPVAYMSFAIEYLLNPFFETANDARTIVNGIPVKTQEIYVDTAIVCLSTMVPIVIAACVIVLRQGRVSRSTESSASEYFAVRNQQK